VDEDAQLLSKLSKAYQNGQSPILDLPGKWCIWLDHLQLLASFAWL